MARFEAEARSILHATVALVASDAPAATRMTGSPLRAISAARKTRPEAPLSGDVASQRVGILRVDEVGGAKLLVSEGTPGRADRKMCYN